MYSVDYLIGDAAYLGKGYGKLIVKELIDLIIEKEKPKLIVVKPDKDNMASNQVLLANGFVFDTYMDYYCKSYA